MIAFLTRLLGLSERPLPAEIARARSARDLERLARRHEANSPALAAELRSIAGRD